MNSKGLLRNLKKGFGGRALRPAVRQGNIINPHINMVNVHLENAPFALTNMLDELKKLDINFYNIESDFILGNVSEVEIKFFFENLSGNVSIDDVKTALRNISRKVKVEPTPIVPNFPIKLSDLNDMGINLQTPSDGLNQDHPGFKDKVYRERRDFIGRSSVDYKMLDDIPRISYTQQETDLWKHIYTSLKPLLNAHANSEYVENFAILEKDGIFSPNKIPQLDEINKYLIAKTNWRVKPVNGILSQREYLNCLAYRAFPSTQYLRHHTKPFYTPEPDIVHEFIGHIPNFCDPVFCDVSQQLGLLSLGASDRVVKLIGAVYWFTVEFGACRQNNQMKFYGSGIASSVDEIHNFLNSKDVRPLDLQKEYPPVDFVVQDVQPFYYSISRFDEYLEQLRLLSMQMNRIFKYNMDKDSKFLFVDRKIEVMSEKHESPAH